MLGRAEEGLQTGPGTGLQTGSQVKNLFITLLSYIVHLAFDQMVAQAIEDNFHFRTSDGSIESCIYFRL